MAGEHEDLSGRSVLFLFCDTCGGDECFSAAVVAGHGVHVFCNACDTTISCLTPDSLNRLIANAHCSNCGEGAVGERDGSH